MAYIPMVPYLTSMYDIIVGRFCFVDVVAEGSVLEYVRTVSLSFCHRQTSVYQVIQVYL